MSNEQSFIQSVKSTKRNRRGRFQINSKRIALTYPQCTLSEQEAIQALRERHPNLSYCCFVKESHASGEPHLHGLAVYSSGFRTSSQSEFDIGEFHPNIQAVKNLNAWQKYLCKENKPVEWGEMPATLIQLDTKQLDQENILFAAKSMPKLEFLCFMSANKRVNGCQIWDLANPDLSKTIMEDTPNEGIIEPSLKESLTKYELDPKYSLLVIGEPGVGKTTWCKSIAPKPCLFVNHSDDLKDFQEGFHKSILFDDVSFNHMPIQAQISLVDIENSRSIHCRYRVAHIPKGIVKIFASNSFPVDIDNGAIRRRIKIIKITRFDHGSQSGFSTKFY